MEYNFTEIERRSKEKWAKEKVYKISTDVSKPKCYVLDMFPYPSGAGLHVGHPLGYIASDIYSRYKRLKGFNVLHPMGFDAFGLPAEQYALETGQHPAITTKKNIARYKEQLDNIGFSFDWDREVCTSEPAYYKWTQWIFLQLFNSWYDRHENKARKLDELVNIFELEGNLNHTSPGNEKIKFSNKEWLQFTRIQKRDILMSYRIAYQDYAQVWWCEALGTVLANDEVINGFSERGNYPVEKKIMRQWFLRITEYAERLLNNLDTLDWSDSMKDMQRNWIGKSFGAEVEFSLPDNDQKITVFTTRPDTIFGVDFMVLAPEHELVSSVTTGKQKQDIEEYIKYVKSRSERERISEVKQATGCFTGAYAIHPLLPSKQVPIWISEYVLAGYGTGAIMGVPSGDERDHLFAKQFNIPVTNIFGNKYTGSAAYSDKTGTIENSDFITGMKISDATEAVINKLVSLGLGCRKTNYRLRDAGFSRQRYWGEPFPIVYHNNQPFGIDELDIIPDITDEQVSELKKLQFGALPVILPSVESYRPGPEGQGPLANIEHWVNTVAGKRETNTMPGYAGSSWYFLRYADPNNETEFASHAATDYWNQVDLYVGGTEHAVGHLLYARMWTKTLFDLGYIGFEEPFKKLLNQGMIQGKSYFTYSFYASEQGLENEVFFLVSQEKAINLQDTFEWHGKSYKKNTGCNNYRMKNVHFYVDTKGRLTVAKFKELLSSEGVKEGASEDLLNYVIWDGKNEDNSDYIQCTLEIEKMSKSKYNVVNPDDIVTEYGADTFRMYEMFLGPIDVSKPWDTKGIEGVHRFLKKMWRLYFDEQKGFIVNDDVPTAEELRILHKLIYKVSDDIERFSFNTSVSQFMITVNELTNLSCHKRGVLEPLIILLCPFAPHIAEELWRYLGNETSIVNAQFPQYEEIFTKENTKMYPVAVNGKSRLEMEFSLDVEAGEIERAVLSEPVIQKWMEGKPMKKLIYVKGKMINVVV